ncbi:MAG: prepilin peptidase [Deltaproteobacteria bacterium]|nr:prepilin peptidase [Deltaproteobacteria bacterium]
MNYDAAYALFTGYAGLLGLLFGSFMNVCISRMPEDRSVVSPRSACPSCGTPIAAYDNIPVLSWFVLRGRCRHCKASISPLYPLVEAQFAVLAALLFRRVVPDLGNLDTAHLVAFIWYFWLCFAVLAMTFIDLRHSIIPDEFSIYSVPVGVGGAALLGFLGYEGAPTWQQSLVGASAGGLGIAAIIGLYWVLTRQEGMGWGDAKLMALFGAYFGPFPGLFAVLMIGSTTGALVGGSAALAQIIARPPEWPGEAGLSGPARLGQYLASLRRRFQVAVPFGPFLGMGAVAWLFFGQSLAMRWSGTIGRFADALR